jgi:hypothetical protein
MYDEQKHRRVLVASWEIGPEGNSDEAEYIYIGIAQEQNAGQNQNVKAGNKPFKSVTYFQYLPTAISQNCIYAETKIRLNSGNAC